MLSSTMTVPELICVLWWNLLTHTLLNMKTSTALTRSELAYDYDFFSRIYILSVGHFCSLWQTLVAEHILSSVLVLSIRWTPVSISVICFYPPFELHAKLNHDSSRGNLIWPTLLLHLIWPTLLNMKNLEFYFTYCFHKTRISCWSIGYISHWAARDII